MAQTLSQTVCHFLKKLDLHLSRHSAITLLGMYPRKTEAYIHTKTCAPHKQQLHLAVTQAGKQTRGPPHAGRNGRPYSKQPGWISGVQPQVKGARVTGDTLCDCICKKQNYGGGHQGLCGGGCGYQREFWG